MSRRVVVTGGTGFIGSALVKVLHEAGATVYILDNRRPATTEVEWLDIDLMRRDGVSNVLRSVQPDLVFHLAARTDTDSGLVEDYLVNTEGTRNLVRACNDIGVEMFLHTSTQYVAGPGTDVSDPLNLAPFTAYGESKAQSEAIVRSECESPWIIVRPTNVWGPRHPRYPYEFWKVLQQGVYLHPAGKPVYRTYGYVENVAQQMADLAQMGSAVAGGTYYLGDSAIDLSVWADAFSVALTGRNARRVPYRMLQFVARCGDLMRRFGLKAPLYSTRFRSMTEDYVVPLEPTLALLGSPPISMNEGVRRSVKWMKDEGLVRTARDLKPQRS